MRNAISIDLEDWFCVNNLSQSIRRSDWEKCEQRVLESTTRILNLFERHNTKGTFFVLGWVAERVPQLVREIEECGHEVAVHGYSHLLLTEISPKEFEADLARALDAIAACGLKKRPIGYRAPSFTVVPSTKRWALEILEKYQFKYDSSVFPVGFHPDYGMADSPVTPYQITETLMEFPMSCLEVLGKRLPFCGGGYFRLFPYVYTKYCMSRFNSQGRAAVFYLHPWEIDAEQPRIKDLSVLKRFRHYRNLGGTEKKLDRLLGDFEFTTIREVLQL